MKSKSLILLPTLNEFKNLKNLYSEIKKLNLNMDILLIDDGSTDGTLDVIQEIVNDNPNSNHKILRSERLGIGSAHTLGINWCYDREYDFIITMDTDYAHDPKYILDLIKFREEYDLVLGSRFLLKAGTPQWSIFRKILSRGSHLVSFILYKHNFDSTNSFRCYNLKSINRNFLKYCNYSHYEYFLTSITILNSKKYKIKQFPMVIKGRQEGKSKMNLKHIARSIFFTFYFYLKLTLIKRKN